jgi:hypothetical protein
MLPAVDESGSNGEAVMGGGHEELFGFVLGSEVSAEEGRVAA